MPGKRPSVLAIAPALASLLLAVGVATVFCGCGPKDDGTWMKCHAAQDAIMWMALAITVVLAVAAFAKNGKVGAVLYLAGAVASGVVFALPGTIMPMCMMQTMRCYEIMQPFVQLMSVLVIIMCLVAGIRCARRMKQPASTQAR